MQGGGDRVRERDSCALVRRTGGEVGNLVRKVARWVAEQLKKIEQNALVTGRGREGQGGD